MKILEKLMNKMLFIDRIIFQLALTLKMESDIIKKESEYNALL